MDEGYHLFVRDDDPDAQDPLTTDLKIQALNPDDSVDVSYDRSVTLRLKSENGDTGELAAGVPYVVPAEDEYKVEISGTSEDSITATLRSVDHFDVSNVTDSYEQQSVVRPLHGSGVAPYLQFGIPGRVDLGIRARFVFSPDVKGADDVYINYYDIRGYDTEPLDVGGFHLACSQARLKRGYR